MKKKTSLSAKLIAAFMAAILGSVLICALLTHSKVESVLNSNMQLTSCLLYTSDAADEL